MRLIDADALEYTRMDIHMSCETIDAVPYYDIESAPTIEAEPVRRGYWLWDGKHHYCSVCSGTRYHDLVLGIDAAYCPYCGAKLEGVKDGR